MLTVRATLVSLLLLAPAVAQAQSLRGTIVDDDTGEPVAGAMVTVFLGDFPLVNSRSDSAGVFVAVPARPGPFLLRVTHPHYAPIDRMELAAAAGEFVTLEVRLGRTVVPLEPLVVTARSDPRLAGFHERRRRSAHGRFIERAHIELRPGAQTTDLLRHVPGITIFAEGRGGADELPAPFTLDATMPRVPVIAMRGRTGTCLPALFLDGMRVQQFVDSGIDDFLKPEMLEGVEIYPGSVGAPVEFADPAGCGSVVFWSRGGLPGTRHAWRRALASVAAFVVLVTLVR